MCAPPSPPPPPPLPPTPIPTSIIFGALSWPAWTPDVTPATFGIAPSLFTTYSNRQPSGWGPGTSGNWYLWSVLSPSSINTQSIIDARILTFQNALDFIIYDWYPPASTVPLNPTSVSGIIIPYQAHGTSPYASLVKRALLLQPAWLAYPSGTISGTWPNISAYAAWISNEFLDPNYMRDPVSGKPIIGLFNPPDVKLGAANTAWLDFLSRLSEPVYVIGYGNVLGAAGTATQCRAMTSYGQLGATPTPNGQTLWSAQVTKDNAIFGVPGFDLCYSTVALADQRPRKGAACAWVDRPNAPDFVTSIQTPAAATPKFIMIGEAVDELDEGGGGITPTIQDGSYFADLIKYVRGNNLLASYAYRVGASLISYVTQSVGTWTTNTGVTGAYDNTEMRTSAAGATLTFSHVRALQMSVQGPLGPGFGTFDVHLDGVLVASVNQSAGSTTRNNTLWASGALASGTHTVDVIQTSGTVAVDAFPVTYVPNP